MIMRFWVMRLVALLAVVFYPLGLCFGEQDSEISDFILAGLKNSRQTLLSGTVKASGRIMSVSSSRPQSRDWRFQLTFDNAQSLYRIEQELAVLITNQDPVQNAIKFLRAPDFAYEWMHGPFGNGLQIRPRDYLGSRELLLIDPQALGLASIRNFMNKETVAKNLSSMGARKWRCERLPNSRVWRLESFEDKKSIGVQVLQEMYLDESKQYVPLRIEHYFNDSGQDLSKASREKWGKSVYSQVSVWERHKDVWVPKSILVLHGTQSYELELIWESVNEPIDSKEFTVQALQLSPSDPVFDWRTGESVNFGKVQDLLGGPLARPEAKSSERSGGLRAWFIGANVVALVVLAIWYFVSRPVG